VIEKFQSTLRGLMGAMLTPTTAWAEVERMIVGKPFAKALADSTLTLTLTLTLNLTPTLTLTPTRTRTRTRTLALTKALAEAECKAAFEELVASLQPEDEEEEGEQASMKP